MTTARSPISTSRADFPGIKPDEVEEIIAQSRVQSYPAGAVILPRDALENTFYMILAGDLEVTKVINNSEPAY